MTIPTREGEPIKGITYIQSVPGIDRRFLSVLADTPAEDLRERLHYVEEGDRITIFSRKRPERVLWSGEVDGRTPSFLTYDYNGSYDFPKPTRVRRETWIGYFVSSHPASLVKPNKVPQPATEPTTYVDENRKQPAETSPLDTDPVDPFEEFEITYQALSDLGYPVNFVPGRDNPDQNESHNKFRTMKYLVGIHGISQILGDIAYGRVHKLAKLLKGQEDDYYSLSPQSPQGLNPEGRYQGTPETFKKCFMRGYLRYHELVAAGRMYFDKKGGKYGHFTATPDEADNELHKKYTEENIKPITSEELIEMTREVASAILTQFPWYQPI